MTILRTDKIAGLESVNAITGSVFFGNNGFDSSTAKNKNFLLTEDGNSDLSLGTSDFTVEGWFWTSRAADLTQDYQAIISDSIYSSNYSWSFYIYQDEIKLWTCTTSCSALITGGSISSNTWHHFAWTRTGGTSRVFIDGSLIGSAADTTNYGDDRIMIGANKWSEAKPYGYYGINSGYISNIRIQKGKAEYTAAFTPPTRQLEVTPETVLLCCQSSQDPTKEETGKLLEAHKLGDAPGPLPSTFAPDVGNDHTYGTILEGDVEFTSLNYMTLPRGTTTQSNRGRALLMGNQSSAADGMKYFSLISSGNTILFGDLTSNASGWGAAGASSTRGVIGGGSPVTNTMEYVTIATTGNALNFGDLTLARRHAGVVGNNTRGCWGGGETAGAATQTDRIDYITFASTGNAIDFGNLTDARRGCPGGSSPTRGLFAGGQLESPAPATHQNTIDYITIATAGNATDFGDLNNILMNFAGTSSPTRAVWAGGDAPAGGTAINNIDYVTIASTGNATNFGDLQTKTSGMIGASASHIRAMWTGGYAVNHWTNGIQFITIATTGDSAEWGDLIAGNDNERGGYMGATSDSHGGLSE